MKIAIATSGRDLSAPLMSQFGRADAFVIYDLDHKTHEILDNTQSLEAAHGAGIHAAEAMVHCGVSVVIAGRCGPKASRVLDAAGIRFASCDAATVNEALQRYIKGELGEVDATSFTEENA